MKSRHWIVTALVVTLAACGGDEQAERVELGAEPSSEEGRASARANWSPEFTARVDSANAAYAEGDYQTAQRIYADLTEERSDLGVVWFGLYMAENALGNDEAAAEALARAEEMNPGLGRMHEAATDSGARVPMIMEGHPPIMPEGHPPMDSGSPEDAAQMRDQSGD